MRRLWIYGLGVVVAVVIAGFGALYSGIYNVAATEEHTEIVRWLLETGMERSVAAHAPESAPPPLDDPALIDIGARHYAADCAACHGGPGVRAEPFTAMMLPQPPVLADKIDRFTSNELFFIVKHGLKYTGMPGWPSQQRDDEVWAAVAFIELLPGMSAEQYAGLTGGLADASAFAESSPGSAERIVEDCAVCHGVNGEGLATGGAPRLAGLSFDYLVEELDAYAIGARPSGIMQSAVSDLGPEDRRLAAEYYAAVAATPSGAAPDLALVAAGAALAGGGNAERAVPPCAACHDAPDIAAPALAGQHAHYIDQQLRLFRAGIRTDTVMTPIASTLTDEQIAAVAAYYASLGAL